MKKTPRCGPELRRRVSDLVEGGRKVAQVATDDPMEQAIYKKWNRHLLIPGWARGTPPNLLLSR